MAHTPWTPNDEALLRSAYQAWTGAGPLVIQPRLLKRHTFQSCRQRASLLGLTRITRPRQADVPFTLTPTQAAYLAGLIDGEGHVSGMKPLVQITTTTKEILDWLLVTIPVGRTQKPGVTSTGKPIYRWLLSTTHGCGRLYAQVLPYLLIESKRENMGKFTALNYAA
jgi:hypothetical protein